MKTKVKEICQYLEAWAPLPLQESYDNAGLLCGNPDQSCEKILCTLDCTEAVLEEAIEQKCQLIVAHHPIIFKGLKSLTGKSYVERTIIKAIKQDVAIYAIHTNLDHVHTGVNRKIGEQLGLDQLRILQSKSGQLKKLELFIPAEKSDEVMEAIHRAGAGNIGNYSHCSFRVNGTGTFLPNASAKPSIGKAHQLEKVKEDRLEVVFPAHLEKAIVKAMYQSHPYEEVAYFISQLENHHQEYGAGMIGELGHALNEEEFLKHVRKSMDCNTIRYTPYKGSIKKVAFCGGAGSFLLKEAIRQGADAFVTADFKYHEFFDAEERLMIADIGHYESEVFTKDLLSEYLSKKFTNIAVNLSKVNTNPVSYF